MPFDMLQLITSFFYSLKTNIYFGIHLNDTCTIIIEKIKENYHYHSITNKTISIMIHILKHIKTLSNISIAKIAKSKYII